MTEYKFRAYCKWDNESNRFVFPIIFDNKAYFHIDGKLIELKNYIINQYIGIKDDNGKEMYEGDIIKYNDNELGIFYYKVIWHDTGFWAEGLEDKDYYHLIEFANIEVIGNIYENPELLENIK